MSRKIDRTGERAEHEEPNGGPEAESSAANEGASEAVTDDPHYWGMVPRHKPRPRPAGGNGFWSF
ncbi:hypothetical protein ACFVWY_14715 [Streptomyces sp. NPDC058195]|uniref:hypothetical protein n=1 Tax=Streptomyces sp. NPDC058195 TaxID=3346375 RepID=UPI0036E92CAE